MVATQFLTMTVSAFGMRAGLMRGARKYVD